MSKPGTSTNPSRAYTRAARSSSGCRCASVGAGREAALERARTRSPRRRRGGGHAGTTADARQVDARPGQPVDCGSRRRSRPARRRGTPSAVSTRGAPRCPRIQSGAGSPSNSSVEGGRVDATTVARSVVASIVRARDAGAGRSDAAAGPSAAGGTAAVRCVPVRSRPGPAAPTARRAPRRTPARPRGRRRRRSRRRCSTAGGRARGHQPEPVQRPGARAQLAVDLPRVARGRAHASALRGV